MEITSQVNSYDPSITQPIAPKQPAETKPNTVENKDESTQNEQAEKKTDEAKERQTKTLQTYQASGNATTTAMNQSTKEYIA